jgi:NTE family protein
MAGPTRVALALGSGGARGYAHIGVIQALQDRGYEIAAVAGSSMGALVGGLHAAGRLDEWVAWARGLRQIDVVRLLDPSLSAPGVIRAGKVLGRVRDLLDGARIEDLPIPYTAVATDLLARREVWFQAGSVAVAVRASIAIPGMITPVMLNGRLLADGGITNPVPIAPTTSIPTDATIAVSLGGSSRGPDGGHAVKETAEVRPAEEWAERFRVGASQLLDREVVRSVLQRFGGGSSAEPAADAVPEDAAALDALVEAGEPIEPVDPDDPFGPLPSGLGKLDMMYRAMDAMQSVLVRYRMAGYPPDVLVEVPRDACRSLDFHRAAEMIDLGRALAEEALDRSALAPSPGAASPAEAAPG